MSDNKPGIVYRSATPDDLAAVESLLAESSLPTAGVRDCIESFIVAESEGDLVGTIGLEPHEPHALLRSLAVAERWRGNRIGNSLVTQLLSEAQRRGAQRVFLLTTTAAEYFPAFGFAEIPRSLAPVELLKSEEFRGACPASAALTEKRVSD